MIDEIIGSTALVRGDGNHKYHNVYEDSTYRKMEEVPNISLSLSLSLSEWLCFFILAISDDNGIQHLDENIST